MLTRWSYLLDALVCSFVVLPCLAQSTENISIPNTSPQIEYSPFLCNVTGSASFSPSCLGGWQVLTSEEGTILSSEGAGPLGANIVPQMFLRFQASTLFLTTSTSSNATFTITVSVGDDIANASANSSVGQAGIFNLPENETTTLSVTFDAGQIPSHLDIGNITIQVPVNSSLSSALPTQTLPPSVSLPIFVSTSSGSSSTSTPSSTSSTQSDAAKHKQLIDVAVGLTLGLGLGLTLIITLMYFAWKRRRRRQQDDNEWRHTGRPRSQHTPLDFIRSDNQNSDSTGWF